MPESDTPEVNNTEKKKEELVIQSVQVEKIKK